MEVVRSALERVRSLVCPVWIFVNSPLVILKAPYQK